MKIVIEVSAREKWAVLAIAGMLGSGLLIAEAVADVPHRFASGDVLTAAALNENFGALDVRIAAATLPKGAVVAFDLESCPEGWDLYLEGGGRTIVGVNEQGNNGLSERALGDVLGEEAHTMSIEQMPEHTHTMAVFGGVGSFANNTTDLRVLGGSQIQSTFGVSGQSTSSGHGQPFTNFQPSVVLRYCVKL